MSTKIYDGFILRNVPSFKDVVRFCNLYGQQVLDKYESELTARLSRLQYFIVDAHLYNDLSLLSFLKDNPSSGSSPYSMAYMHALHLSNTSDNTILTSNFVAELQECAVNMYSINDDVLMIFFGWHGYCDILRGMDGLEEYAYFNNTDKPDNISQEEWDQRYNIWEKSGALDNSPELNILRYTPLGNTPGIPFIDKDHPFIPTKAERAAKLGKAILRKQLDEYCIRENITKASKVTEWVEDHQEDLKNMISELEPQIIPLTQEHMNMPISKLLETFANTNYRKPL
jgi:hypothetical protein